MKYKFIITCSLLIFIYGYNFAQDKVSCFVKDNNIYTENAAGNLIQLTNLGKDREPLLSLDKKKVYFIRQTGKMGDAAYDSEEQIAIMQVNINDLKEEILADKIDYKDWGTSSKLFAAVGFTLSNDGRYLFFITQKWTTSGVLVKLDIKTKKITEISHADDFELIKDGKYKNYFIVNRSEIKENEGRTLSNWLLNMEGKAIKEIGDDAALAKFKLPQKGATK